MKKILSIILFLAPFYLLFGAGAEKSLLILTTEKINSTSKQLQNFVKEKEIRGFDVRVATENDFGGEGKVGIEKALIIRKWLKENGLGYRFLLLIGGSDSVKGEIPMVDTWPLHLFPEESEGPYPTNEPVPTDMFYADLTGKWDLNGNGKYGETGYDFEEGGPDFKVELITGRIPVYNDDTDELDRILSRTIEYMNRSKEETAYRHRLLFPSAFYFFKGQYGSAEDVDGAGISEWFIENYLREKSDFSFTTMYEQEGFSPSIFESDIPLTRDNFIEEWSKGYGVVFWAGHTFYDSITRSVWRKDADGNELADESEVFSAALFFAEDSRSLDGTKPSFLISPNCNAGSVKVHGNITHETLKNGAVGVMSATISSTPVRRVWNVEDPFPDNINFGDDLAGIVTTMAIVEGGYPAEALLKAKSEYGKPEALKEMGKEGPYVAGICLANKLMFNWYGDPTLTLTATSDDIIECENETPDTDSGEDESSRENSGGGCSLTLF